MKTDVFDSPGMTPTFLLSCATSFFCNGHHLKLFHKPEASAIHLLSALGIYFHLKLSQKLKLGSSTCISLDSPIAAATALTLLCGREFLLPVNYSLCIEMNAMCPEIENPIGREGSIEESPELSQIFFLKFSCPFCIKSQIYQGPIFQSNRTPVQLWLNSGLNIHLSWVTVWQLHERISLSVLHWQWGALSNCEGWCSVLIQSQSPCM